MRQPKTAVPSANSAPALVTLPALARLIGLNRRTLRRVLAGDRIESVQLGTARNSLIAYRREDLQGWCARHRISIDFQNINPAQDERRAPEMSLRPPAARFNPERKS